MTPWTTSSWIIGTRSIDSTSSVLPMTIPRPSAAASPRRTGRPLAATQPVRPSPTGTRRRVRSGVVVPRSVPSKAIGSHIPVPWSTR